MAIEKKSLIGNSKTRSTKSTVKATPATKLRTAMHMTTAIKLAKGFTK